MVAIELAIDAHGIFVLPCRASSPAWRSCSLCAAGAGHGLDSGDVGIVGVDLAQAIEGFIGLVGRCRSACSRGPAGQSFSVVGVGEQNLLPQLDGHVGPAAGFKSVGLFNEAGARGLGGVGDGAVFGRGLAGSASSRQPAINTTRFPSPAAQPSSALPFYVQFAPGTKPESAVEKSGSKQGEILIVIRRVLSIQTRIRVFLRVQAHRSAERLPARDRERRADRATRPQKIL